MQKAKRIIQFISDTYFRMLNSLNIAAKCILPPHVKKIKCHYLQLAMQLKKYLMCFDKTIDEKIIFFIVFCMRNLPLFVKFYESAKKVHTKRIL